MFEYDVIIMGADPAGIFVALELEKTAPQAKVLMIDSGSTIARRACPARTRGICTHCGPCHIMNGWARAGAFSNDKLSLFYEMGGNVTDYLPREGVTNLIHYADGIYLGFGTPETVYGLSDKFVDKITYEAKKHNVQLVPCPVRHMGTECSYEVLNRMYDYLNTKENFTFLEYTTAETIQNESGKAIGVWTINKQGERKHPTAPHIVLAPGRGGADWLTRVAAENGISTTSDVVDIGVRVEVPNAVMDPPTAHLYEVELVYYPDTFENKVRTLCMNPGGIVSEEHYEGGIGGNRITVVNGHSYTDEGRRTDNTSFVLLASTSFTEPFYQPIEYGRYIAQLGNTLTGDGIMVQRLGDLLMGRHIDVSRLRRSTTVSTLKNAVPGDLSLVLPHRHLTSVVEDLHAFDKTAPGLYSKNTLLYGVEVKFCSSEVKVKNTFETSVENLYAIGDGAGITRGLMQASVTGVVVARSIAESMQKQK